MNPYIRTLVEGITRRPVLIRSEFLTEGVTVAGKEVTSWGNFAADLKALATVDVAEQVNLIDIRRDELCKAYGFVGSDRGKSFAFAQGAAIIPIHGTLLNRMPYSFSFATGYNFITSQLQAAMADPDVQQIIYDVNSNGGVVNGCPECADTIFQSNASNGGKPSTAVVDSNCYSAAYYLASAADRIVVTPSGGAGSIGVLQMHMDVSKALDEFGVKMTFIKGGDHKVDGNMFEPLSDEVKASIQADIDKIYSTFVSAVASFRPGLTEEAVRDTQARCYLAADALSLGLVDSVQTPSDALQSALNQTDDQEFDMPGANQPNQPATLTQADVDAAAQTARLAERSRISGIIGHAEAQGRTALANHLANNTDMTVEAAAAVLAASAKEAAVVAETKTETNHFANAMDKGGNPNVGGGNAGENGVGNDKPSRAAQILAAQSKMTGRKLVPIAAK